VKAELRYLLAERSGANVAEEFGFTTFPVEPRQIAHKKDIVVEAKDLTGCCGCLIYHDGMFAIAHSSSLANAGMVNFTIAHELGHYFLEGHATELFHGVDGAHQSAGAFQSQDPREREADRFAVGLLLPEGLFRRKMNACDGGLQGIKALQSICGTSLTSTAIRFATLAEEPVAVIVARDARVEYCFMSDALREIRELQWLKKGSSISRESVTAELSSNRERIERAEVIEGWSSFDLWFDGAPECECQEDVIGLGKFGQTLTVLWCEEALTDDDDE